MMKKAVRMLTASLHTFFAHRGGHFAMLTALTAPLTVLAAAFAVDIGSNYVHERRVQSVTDLAAISAVANIGRPAEAALLTYADNGFPDISVVGEGDATSVGGTIEVVPGRYVADHAVPKAQRFQPLAQPHNAVRIAYRGTGKRHFAGAISPAPAVAAQAVATAHAQAALSIGSRLAQLDEGVANSLLSEVTGSTVDLSVMDYRSLLAADVDLLTVLDDLAVDLDLTAASFDKVLDTRITMGQLAETLSRNGSIGATGQAALRRLRAATGLRSGETLRIGEIVGADIRHLSTGQISALDLVMAAATIAGAGKQVRLDLGTSLPGGLLSVDLHLGIGERPQGAWFSVGSQGQIVRTAQTRLGLVAQIGGSGGILPSIIRVPLLLEIAHAQATIDDIECTPQSVSVKAKPGIANLRIGSFRDDRLADFSRSPANGPTHLINLALVKVSVEADVTVGSMTAERLAFTRHDVDNGTKKTVRSRDFTTSLTQSLFRDLRLDINVIGLGLGVPSGLTGTVAGLLQGVAPALDQVLDNVLETLGLSLGQAVVQVHGIRCQRAVLVQ